PIPIIVPCHRVIAGDSLGGYSGGLPGHELETKRRLLEWENALPQPLFCRSPEPTHALPVHSILPVCAHCAEAKTRFWRSRLGAVTMSEATAGSITPRQVPNSTGFTRNAASGSFPHCRHSGSAHSHPQSHRTPDFVHSLSGRPFHPGTTIV